MKTILARSYEDEDAWPREDDPSEVPPMTVCVAALCENGKAAVLAADRSIAWGPFFASNGPDCKIKAVCSRVVFAVADTPLGGDFSDQFDAEEISNLPMREVADRIALALQEERKGRILSDVLSNLGPWKNIDEFRKECRDHPSDQFLREAWEKAEGYKFKTRIIVSGIGRAGGRLYKTNEFCTPIPHDKPGYTAIGAGEHLAIGNLFSRSHGIKEMGVAEAAYFVYEAKKMGERADRVGVETDMVIIRDKVMRLSAETIAGLDRIYQNLKPRDLSAADRDSLENIVG